MISLVGVSAGVGLAASLLDIKNNIGKLKLAIHGTKIAGKKVKKKLTGK